MRVFIVVVLFLVALPTYAQASQKWAVQAAGQTKCSGTYVGAANPPQIGIDINGFPPGSAIVLFTPIDNDLEISHYSITDDGILNHLNPVTGLASPNPQAAEDAILADPAITADAKIELMKFKSILDSYPQNVATVQQAWALIKATDLKISSLDATAVEADCAAANMPLE